TRAERQTVIRFFQGHGSFHRLRAMRSRRLGSERPEQEMPRRVHSRVNERGGKNRSGSSPRPAVENPCNGSKHDVAPVRESQIGDMRKSEEDGSGPPAGNFALGSAGQEILQQAPEEKFLRPGGEEENAQSGQRQRLPFAPLRFELDEVHACAQRNGNAGEGEKSGQDEKSPALAPAKGVPHAVDVPQEDECREVHADKVQAGM